MPWRVIIFFEPTEAFSLSLVSPSTGVIVGPTTASGTIQDDDFVFAYSVALVKKPDTDEANDDSAAAAALLLGTSADTLSEGGDERSSTTGNTAGDEGLNLSRTGQRWSQEIEDLKASLGEVRLFFVQVDVSGLESAQKYELPVNMLEGDRLLELFKKFPNGHYRVYLEQDRSLRKLYDLHIYGHQLTTPEVPPANRPRPERRRWPRLTSSWKRRSPDSPTRDAPSDDRFGAVLETLPSTAAAMLLSARLRRSTAEPGPGRIGRTEVSKTADWSRAGRILRELQRHFNDY